MERASDEGFVRATTTTNVPAVFGALTAITGRLPSGSPHPRRRAWWSWTSTPSSLVQVNPPALHRCVRVCV